MRALSELQGCVPFFAQRPFLFEEALDGKKMEFEGLQQSFFYRIFLRTRERWSIFSYIFVTVVRCSFCFIYSVSTVSEAMFESDLYMRGDFLGGREEFKGDVHHLFKVSAVSA